MGKALLGPSNANPYDWRNRPVPAPGSLRAILLGNSTTRLYVHPLEWTDQHLKALDVDIREGAKMELEDYIPQGDENAQLREAVLELQDARSITRDQQTRLFVRSAALVTQLQQILTESTLSFEYNNRPVTVLPPLFVAWHQPTRGKIPIWAYIDQKWTSAARRKRFVAHMKSWSFATKAVKGMQELPIDPVYVAILISLAQLRRRNGLQELHSHKVSLFVPQHEPAPKTSQSNTTTLGTAKSKQVTRLIQYTASVPISYLQKFEDPYQFYEDALRIEKRTLPTNDPAWFIQAMNTTFQESACSMASLPLQPPLLKRKALNELDRNTEEHSPNLKRAKVSESSRGLT